MVYNWEDYKNVITRLYVQENKQVDEIIEYMSHHYDFKPRYVCPTHPTPGLHLGFFGTAMRSPVRRGALSPAIDLRWVRARPRLPPVVVYIVIVFSLLTLMTANAHTSCNFAFGSFPRNTSLPLTMPP